jgi:hypothetical protein
VRYTLDTGALIGIERRDKRAVAFWRTALALLPDVSGDQHVPVESAA